MIYKSHAKVNLALDILGVEKNGYHLVQTILQKISLADEICIQESGENSVIFEGKEAHLIDRNNSTVTKALTLINPSKRYTITVKKNIPLGAGLGGGSSNAATVLTAINQMEQLDMSNSQLCEIGSKIGIDVPFFIRGGTAFGEHYGEKITKLPNLKWENFYKVLIIPHIRKQTKLQYNKLDLSLCGKNKNQTKKMIEILKTDDHSSLFALMHNDFETIASQELTEITHALKADYSILCGSGTAVLGISNNPFDLRELSRALPNQHILSLLQ